MRLPAAEHEAVCLRIYVELTSAQVAEILQVDERTVLRYWQSAIKNWPAIQEDCAKGDDEV